MSGFTIRVAAAITLTGIAPNFHFDIYLVLQANGIGIPGSIPLAIGSNLVTDAMGNAQVTGPNTFYRSISPTLEADTIQVQVCANQFTTKPQYSAQITPRNTPYTGA